MKSVFHRNKPGREKHAKQCWLGIIILPTSTAAVRTQKKGPKSLCNVKISVNLKEQTQNRTSDPPIRTIPNKSVFCERSGLFGYFILHISSITSDSICGLVLHFSVNQLNRNRCLWCVSEHTPLPGLFFFGACCLFRYIRLCSMPRSFPS